MKAIRKIKLLQFVYSTREDTIKKKLEVKPLKVQVPPPHLDLNASYFVRFFQPFFPLILSSPIICLMGLAPLPLSGFTPYLAPLNPTVKMYCTYGFS